MYSDLQDRVALITGSSRGIGWATARLLARQGANIVFHGRTESEQFQQRAAELRAMSVNGAQVLPLTFDLADASCIRECFRTIFATFKRLDILVNNAGEMKPGVIGMISDASILRGFEVNTFSAILASQEAARLMTRNGGGSMINLVSIMATQGAEGHSVYAAAKAALVGLTLSTARELAPKNIRVNAVAPGFIKTDMTAALPPEQVNKAVAKIRIGRPGDAEDVAHLISFLASDSASYITGQVIGVDGGMYL